MANSLISMVKGDSTLIDNTEVLNGQILFDETKQKIFLDDNTERKEYGGSDDNAVKKDDVAYVESAMVATRGYSAGNYIIVQDTLYKATTQINSGTALVVGTNVSTTTVGNELTQLNNDLAAIDYRLDGLEAVKLRHTRIAINCNTSVSGIEPFKYKGESLQVGQLNDIIYAVTVEKPQGEWIFSVDVNQSTNRVTLYANGRGTVYCDVLYYRPGGN